MVDYRRNILFTHIVLTHKRGRYGRDRMVFGFTTIYAISAYRIPLRAGVLDTTLCDKICQ